MVNCEHKNRTGNLASMTKEFFSVTPVERVFEYISSFEPVGTETIPLLEATGRILAGEVVSGIDIPGFDRSTMDGYAVRAADTFGASEGNPAYLAIRGTINMGTRPERAIGPGEAIRIATGGMMPEGADGVIMIEHAAEIDGETLEIYKRIAPGTNVVKRDEDIGINTRVLTAGTPIRPQEAGILAALGKARISVYKKPIIGIISTGDELVTIDREPAPGQVRDVNTFTLSGAVTAAGGIPRIYGIIKDNFDPLLAAAGRVLTETDAVLLSGGSSVGTRDLTIDVIAAMAGSEILVHGIPVRPGKPTILAAIAGKAFWGLPGHVTSALVIFDIFVRPFVGHLGGNRLFLENRRGIPAVLTRNVVSAQGRIDYVRVRIIEKNGVYHAEPVLGPSGLIRTMVEADGLIEIDMNTEGLEKGTPVNVILV